MSKLNRLKNVMVMIAASAVSETNINNHFFEAVHDGVIEHVKPVFEMAAGLGKRIRQWNEKHIYGLPGFRCGINADGLNNVMLRIAKGAWRGQRSISMPR